MLFSWLAISTNLMNMGSKTHKSHHIPFLLKLPVDCFVPKPAVTTVSQAAADHTISDVINDALHAYCCLVVGCEIGT